MSPAADLLVFAGIMVLGQFSPGPDMLLLTRTALRDGARAGVAVALGIATGLAVHATVAVAGLAVAFERTPWLREFLRHAAALYLAWLAWRLLAEHFRPPAAREKAPGAVPRGRPYFRGLLCNLLNPKAALFLAAVCAPFLVGSRPDWWPLAIGSIVVFQAAALWALWARLLQWPPLRRGYQRSARWIDAAFALALLALALRLLLA